jgi:hypothetical protein
MRVSRQWRDILNRIKSGFGHDVEKMPGDGDTCEFCPACPQLHVNVSVEEVENGNNKYVIRCLCEAYTDRKKII